MPFITDTNAGEAERGEDRCGEQRARGAGRVMPGRFEDADAHFFILRTSFPADFAVGLTGVAPAERLILSTLAHRGAMSQRIR